MNDTSATKGSSSKKEQKPCAWVIEEVSAKETKSLEQAVETLREENAALQKRVAWLENQLQALKEYLREQTARQQGQPNQAQRPSQPEPGEPAQQDKAREQGSQATEQAVPGEAPAQAEQSQTQEGQSGAAGTAKPVDEEKAEKWIRENLEQWLDKPCPFKKSQGRTWRQMAQNAGEKILIKGKPLPPRAYLHTLEGWAACGVWARLKAKVALEIGKLAACA